MLLLIAKRVHAFWDIMKSFILIQLSDLLQNVNLVIKLVKPALIISLLVNNFFFSFIK